MGNYILAFWKAAAVPAWRDAWTFMRTHVWREVAVLVATLLFLAWNSCREGRPFDPLRDLLTGLIVAALASILIWLWHLFIVSPARMKRDLDLRHQADQEKLAEAEARHQADQATLEANQSSLAEAGLRINGLESSCATERDSTAAARRDVARLAAERGQARFATAIVVRYSRLRGATAEEQDRLLFGIADACLLLLKDTGDQEVRAACEEIRAVCIMDQPPIEQLEEPVRKLAAHYFGPEALSV